MNRLKVLLVGLLPWGRHNRRIAAQFKPSGEYHECSADVILRGDVVHRTMRVISYSYWSDTVTVEFFNNGFSAKVVILRRNEYLHLFNRMKQGLITGELPIC